MIASLSCAAQSAVLVYVPRERDGGGRSFYQGAAPCPVCLCLHGAPLSPLPRPGKPRPSPRDIGTGRLSRDARPILRVIPPTLRHTWVGALPRWSLARATPAPARRTRIVQDRRSAGGTGNWALGAVGGRRRGRRYPLMPCVLRPPSSVPCALSVSQPVPDRGRDGERVPPHFPTGCGRHLCVHAWP